MAEATTTPAGAGNDGASAPRLEVGTAPAPGSARAAGAPGGARDPGSAAAESKGEPSRTLAEGRALAEGRGDSGPGASDSSATAGAKGGNEDWRQRLAGGDEKFLKQLARYASEAEFGKAYRALHQKLSSGEYRRALAENAGEDEKAAWRKEHGVPDKWEDYRLELGGGMVAGERDKPVLDLFRRFAHAQNLSEKDASAFATWYYETQDALASMQEDRDEQFYRAAEDALRAEYGADYRRNMNALGNLRNSMPAELAANLMSGRMADGSKIGDSPAFIRWMIATALELNPAATLLPSNAGEHGKSVDGRLEEIRKFRRENPDKYDEDKKLQAEELELLEAQRKLKNRAA